MPRRKLTEEQRLEAKARRLEHARKYERERRRNNPEHIAEIKRKCNRKAFQSPEYRVAYNERRRFLRKRKREQALSNSSSQQNIPTLGNEDLEYDIAFEDLAEHDQVLEDDIAYEDVMTPDLEDDITYEDVMASDIAFEDDTAFEDVMIPDVMPHYIASGVCNAGQHELLTHILSRIQEDSPLRMFVSGSAGTGKSFVIQTLKRNSDNLLLAAFTGKAASIIGGQTLHKTFAIPVSNPLEFTPLPKKQLNRLRKLYKDVRCIVIDEVFLMGYEMFYIVHRRLQELSNRHDEFFGGFHVLLFGDLCQLPCIEKHPLYQTPPSREPLWDAFQFYELTEIMRQSQDREFALLCNRLRTGDLTAKDKQFLKSKVIAFDQIPSDAVIIQKTNKAVDESNRRRISTARGIFESCAVESGRIVPDNVIPLVVGAKYMLTRNLNVPKGLVNNAFCILRDINYEMIDGTKVAKCVWIELSNGDRVPVARVRMIQEPAVHQLPLRLAEAMTFYKAQGSTFAKVAVQMLPGTTYAELYVGISRAVDADGVFLFSEFHLPVKRMNSAWKELQRLIN